MKDVELSFLNILRRALHGCSADACDITDREKWKEIVRLANAHGILPMIIQASWARIVDDSNDRFWMVKPFLKYSREATCRQAQRTADFLTFYSFLNERGLFPAVMKGLVVRNLYPYPEQRFSVDEDLLVLSEEAENIHTALLAYGFKQEGAEDYVRAQEISYRDRERGLYIEVHRALFPLDSRAYSDCNDLFDGTLDRTVEIRIHGVPIRTLEPTDHLLYLICHAYKHFLHGGVGIRQICDICLMGEKWTDNIDWRTIRKKCNLVKISKYAAGLFRIGEQYLGCMMPEVFEDITVDPLPLLEDVLSGGLYGVNDINRAHSATMTLEAVVADRSFRKRRSIIRAAFLPFSSMSNKYPYLHKYPYLLPAAWAQRIFSYILERKEKTKVNPARSIEIGRERIRLLRKYDIIH